MMNFDNVDQKYYITRTITLSPVKLTIYNSYSLIDQSPKIIPKVKKNKCIKLSSCDLDKICFTSSFEPNILNAMCFIEPFIIEHKNHILLWERESKSFKDNIKRPATAHNICQSE